MTLFIHSARSPSHSGGSHVFDEWFLCRPSLRRTDPYASVKNLSFLNGHCIITSEKGKENGQIRAY